MSTDIQPTNGPSLGLFMPGRSARSRVFHWMSIYMLNMSRYVRTLVCVLNLDPVSVLPVYIEMTMNESIVNKLKNKCFVKRLKERLLLLTVSVVCSKLFCCCCSPLFSFFSLFSCDSLVIQRF